VRCSLLVELRWRQEAELVRSGWGLPAPLPSIGMPPSLGCWFWGLAWGCSSAGVGRRSGAKGAVIAAMGCCRRRGRTPALPMSAFTIPSICGACWKRSFGLKTSVMIPIPAPESALCRIDRGARGAWISASRGAELRKRSLGIVVGQPMATRGSPAESRTVPIPPGAESVARRERCLS